jgi:hypothetical protein
MTSPSTSNSISSSWGSADSKEKIIYDINDLIRIIQEKKKRRNETCPGTSKSSSEGSADSTEKITDDIIREFIRIFNEIKKRWNETCPDTSNSSSEGSANSIKIINYRDIMIPDV